jgi:response regulator RpfG family c-di-GMP phosphodiesterase
MVGIPDHILLKPGKLMPQEMEVMMTHAILIRTSPMLSLPTLATLSPLPNVMMMAAEC